VCGITTYEAFRRL